MDSHRVKYDPGDVIFTEGSIGDCAYIVEHGTVVVSVVREGAPSILAHLSVGDILGEMAIVDNRPRSASAHALGHVELTVLSQEHLTHRLEGCDPVVRLMLDSILRRYRETLRMANGVTALDAEDAPDQARVGDGGPSANLSDAITQIKLEHELRHALARDELELHYQPIVDLNDQSIDSFEGLVRWHHPERGLLMPGAFIDAAELGTLVSVFGLHVATLASAGARAIAGQCAAHGRAAPKVHLNVSPRHLAVPSFLEDIGRCVAEAGRQPQDMVLEVTENLLIESPEQALAVLSAAVDRGFEISLDDFGTGYSSLSYLRQFPLAEIKIDRSFVAQMFSDERSLKIVEKLCDLSMSLGVRLVAEGIEDERQAEVLRSMGCGYGQGFHLARPMPLDDALGLLGAGPLALAG